MSCAKFWPGIVCAIVVAMTGQLSAADADKTAFFESRIRPVLVKHCYECHSAKSKKLTGGLLLDTASGFRKGGDSGVPFVVGKPEESLLMEALRYESLEMPPAGRLPDNVIKDFERWIQMGAPDSRTEVATQRVRQAIDIEAGRKFWAFQPPRRHKRPATKNVDWPQSDIDAFVLAKLEAAGLQPAATAKRRTLVRRLYFDLIGLPPSPEEVDAFLNDPSPNAVESLVDRLLESPQFGVHWGRHWLDIARYADSNGSDFNATFHDAWRYRDYVVAAFNKDKPYDQFVIEQIAGDLLPYDSDAERSEQMIATGFLMVGTKMLSERDKEKLRMDVIDEQIDTIGRALMGLTLGCARCHDHKFDPIPTRDYYALAGIFRSSITLQGESQQYVSTWKPSALPTTPEQRAAVNKFKLAKKELTASIAAAKKELTAANKLAKKLRRGENVVTIDDVAATKIGRWKDSTFTSGYVGKGYIHDEDTKKGEKSVRFPIVVPKDAFYDVRLSYTGGNGRAGNVPVTVVGAQGEQVVTLNQKRKPTIENLYESIGRFEFAVGKVASVTISNRGTSGHVIVDAVQLVEVDVRGKPVLSGNKVDAEKLTAADRAVKASDEKVEELNERLKQLTKNVPPPLPQAFAVMERQEIADCEIRIRGEHKNLGPKVPRGFVQVASSRTQLPISSKESGRRELAAWIASPTHPLTARVMVNRIWYHLLGEGIVPSLDNFGIIGARPSHPELLDHLTIDFIEDDWSIKRAIRRIVLSRVYQMSSHYNRKSAEADPKNRLLWRARRRRLPAEAIRDSMMLIGGRLDLTPGGSPVAGLGTLVTTNNSNGQEFDRRTSERRSLYLPIIRNELPTMLTVFDFANPDLVTGKRPVTNVPAQALLLMNSPFVMDSAEQAAARVLAAKPESELELVNQAYRRVLCREPTDAESSRAIAFLAAARKSITAKQSETETVAQALSELIHVLFASSEFRILN
jgi:cytochrome c553